MKRLFAVLLAATSLSGCVLAPVDPGPYPMPDGRYPNSYPAPYPAPYPTPYPGYGYPGSGTVIIQRGYTPPPVIIQRSPPPVIIQRPPPPRHGFEPGHEQWRERQPERRPERGFERGPSFGPGQGSGPQVAPGVAPPPRTLAPLGPGGGMAPNRGPEARPDNRGPERGPGRELQRGPDKWHGFGTNRNQSGEMRQ